MYRIFQITILLLSLMFTNSKLVAQDSDLFIDVDSEGHRVPATLLTRVSLDLHEVTFESALAVISEKGNFKLSYNRSRVPVGKKVTVEMHNVYALEALLQVLEKTNTKLLVTKEGHVAIVPASEGKPGTVAIKGKVTDAETGVPLWGTNITIPQLGRGTSTGEDGAFVLGKIPEGSHTLRFSYVGYEIADVKVVVLAGKNVDDVTVRLKPQAVSLKEVVVTPGQFSIMGTGPGVKQTLTREDLEILPFGEDAYRATIRLPGVTAGDYSAKFTVRGGENDEVLVLLDGMELYEPFHLKDIDGGALSIIDATAIDGIDLLTGGFSAEYGDRKSAVFKMKTRRPESGATRSSVGLSFMNARIATEGSFAQNRGFWFVSARRGYLDLVLGLMGEDDAARPVYYDFLNRVEYRLNDKNILSANFLHASDRMDYVEDDDDRDDTGYKNYYSWLTLKSFPSERLSAETVLSFMRLSHFRNGIGYEGDTNLVEYDVRDNKSVNVWGMKQDWELEISDRWLLKWGANLKHLRANYDYWNFITNYTFQSQNSYTSETDTTTAFLKPSGASMGFFASNRFRVFTPLTAEIGLRYDRVSYSNDNLWSPRLNLVYALGKQTFLRAGAGYFYQSQGIHQLNVPDGDRQFYEAELAKHLVAGVEHTFRNGLNLRLEGYFKDLSRLRPDFRNLGNGIEIFPEAQSDRLRVNLTGGVAKGLEAYVKYDRGGKFTWWASYALAWANDDIHSVIAGDTEFFSESGESTPGRFDQRHSFHLDLNYRPNRKWHLNLAWHVRSGWPYTSQRAMSQVLEDGTTFYYSVPGELNGSNYPSYQRMDVTINRNFYTSKGHISAFLTLVNFYNHNNVQDIDYYWRWNPQLQRPMLVDQEEYWFGFLPSIGLSWSWGY